MVKRLNWRHKIPEAPDRKRIKATRVRLKPYGLTRIIALHKRARSMEAR